MEQLLPVLSLTKVKKNTATRIEGDVSEERIISKIKQNGFITK